jgi:peroxiredoxin
LLTESVLITSSGTIAFCREQRPTPLTHPDPRRGRGTGGPVVLYFYTSATVEAHEFAENIENFAAAGASVIGLPYVPTDKE